MVVNSLNQLDFDRADLERVCHTLKQLLTHGLAYNAVVIVAPYKDDEGSMGFFDTKERVRRLYQGFRSAEYARPAASEHDHFAEVVVE